MDIVERLKFDAARCELQFSKGVAGNISEAAAEIERLRARIKSIEEQATATTEPDMVAVPARLVYEQPAGEKKA